MDYSNIRKEKHIAKLHRIINAGGSLLREAQITLPNRQLAMHRKGLHGAANCFSEIVINSRSKLGDKNY